MADMVVSLVHESRKEYLVGSFEPDHVGIRRCGSGWKHSDGTIRNTFVCSYSREGVHDRGVLVPGNGIQGVVLDPRGKPRRSRDWFGRGKTIT
jgi:hypothetical protein